MNKNKTYIGISFIVLIFGIYFIPKILAKFQKSDLLEVGIAPAFNLTNQDGKEITNEFYKGKVYVVEFFFTTCPTICPIMNKNMVEIQKEFYGNPAFGIASISIDPENDTVEVLKNYSETMSVKHFNWNFLRANDAATVYNLAEKDFKLNAGVDPKAPGGFYHSGSFCLIDKEGKIRTRKDEFGNPMVFYDGLEPEGIKMIKEDIKKLLDE